MAEDTDIGRKLLLLLGGAALAYAAYRFIRGDTVSEALAAPINKVSETATTVKKKFVRFAKGSPEAKAYMKELNAKRIQKKKAAIWVLSMTEKPVDAVEE